MRARAQAPSTLGATLKSAPESTLGATLDSTLDATVRPAARQRARPRGGTRWRRWAACALVLAPLVSDVPSVVSQGCSRGDGSGVALAGGGGRGVR